MIKHYNLAKKNNKKCLKVSCKQVSQAIMGLEKLQASGISSVCEIRRVLAGEEKSGGSEVESNVIRQRLIEK